MFKLQELTINTKVVRESTGNIVTDMDGEKLMMNVQRGKYYNLGEIGGTIWDLIQTPVTVKSLVQDLLENFSVEEEVCQGQVIEFLKTLNKEGLIRITS
jgi:hypothetical protein